MNTLVRKNGNYYPSIFDSVFGKNTLDHLLVQDYSANRPAVNVVENESGYRIELSVPGWKKDDFRINLEADQLTISAEKSTTTEETKEKYNRKEFASQSFKRVFNLPEAVDSEKIGASYEAGILFVSLPKKELPAAPVARQIDIV